MFRSPDLKYSLNRGFFVLQNNDKCMKHIMDFERSYNMLSNERYISVLLLCFFAMMLALVFFANYLYKDYAFKQSNIELYIPK